jgi:hypothetical protein
VCITKRRGDFIRKRGGIDDNYEGLQILIKQLRLTDKKNPGYPTVEEWEELAKDVKRFEWFIDAQLGKDFGNEWKDYHLTYTGVVIAEYEKPKPEGVEPMPYAWLIWHPKDERKLVWICQIRIRYRLSLAYLEIKYQDSSKPNVTLTNAWKVRRQDELLKVWKGLELFRKTQKRGGRQLGDRLKPVEDVYKDLEPVSKPLLKKVPAD